MTTHKILDVYQYVDTNQDFFINEWMKKFSFQMNEKEKHCIEIGYHIALHTFINQLGYQLNKEELEKILNT